LPQFWYAYALKPEKDLGNIKTLERPGKKGFYSSRTKHERREVPSQHFFGFGKEITETGATTPKKVSWV
jgi:hypothetical protein